MRRFERLYAALSRNGTKVHLAHADGTPVCGSRVDAECRVHARVTCAACVRARPRKAARLAKRPYVIGTDPTPLYAALGRALRAGATKEPRIKVRFWPVLGREKAS